MILIRRRWEATRPGGVPGIRAELTELWTASGPSSTVTRYRPARGRTPSQRWEAVLTNHACGIAVMDFYFVPTAAFRLV